MARQIRLRLVAAEDSDIPKNLSNIIVSIHAIATFQALHDYLRPRVAGIMPGTYRLSSMLAALASGAAAASSSAPFLEPPKPPTPENNSSEQALNRRRSLRLREKKSDQLNGGQSTEEGADGEPAAASTSHETADAPSHDTAPSDTVVNDDEFGDFDEDVDLDAEVGVKRRMFEVILTHSL